MDFGNLNHSSNSLSQSNTMTTQDYSAYIVLQESMIKPHDITDVFEFTDVFEIKDLCRLWQYKTYEGKTENMADLVSIILNIKYQMYKEDPGENSEYREVVITKV